MGSGPWRMLADDGHVAYCFLMGASTNQKTVCYAAYHPQMLLIIRLTKQSGHHCLHIDDDVDLEVGVVHDMHRRRRRWRRHRRRRCC